MSPISDYIQRMLLQAGLFLLIFSGMVFGAVRFHRNQNREKDAWTGGPISWPKCFWLNYAIGAWFFLPCVLIFAPGVSQELQAILFLHVAIWWIRGVLELFMIYRWYNWSPVYGITHDGLHNLMLFVGTGWALGRVGWNNVLANPADLHAFILLSITQFAIIAEGVFASLFIATRGTSPDKAKIYFASDDPVFRLINGFTRAVCIIVYSVLGIQTLAMAFAG